MDTSDEHLLRLTRRGALAASAGAVGALAFASRSPAKGYRVAIARAVNPVATPALIGIH